MSWTTPRTWTTSEVVTAAMLNANVRDNTNWLHSSHAVKLFSTSGNIHNVANTTDQAIAFNSEDTDTDGFHSTSANTSRITIPAGLDGLYVFGGIIEWDADTTNGRVAYVKKNNASSVGRTRVDGANSGPTRVEVLTPDMAAAGDYYELVGFQDSGGSLHINGGSLDDTQFFAWLVGA